MAIIQELDRINLSTEIVTLLHEITTDLAEGKGGKITVSAHDTAWVARVIHPTRRELAFPSALDWLLTHQSSQGSWGDPYPYNLLPTMSALVTLLTTPQQTSAVRQAAHSARLFLALTLPGWNVEEHESVGFEVLIPGALHELADLGVRFDFPRQAELLARYQQKLARLPLTRLYTEQNTLLHSLEAFSNLDYSRLPAAFNGSYGCSPAATASILQHHWTEKSAQWLQQVLTWHDGGAPIAYPFEIFEWSWTLYNLSLSNFDLPQLPVNKIMDHLVASLGTHGASFSQVNGMPPDADDTSMVILLAKRFGKAVSLEPLLNYELSDHFYCYAGEQNPSYSANAHCLQALIACGQSNTPSANKVVEFLLTSRTKEGYWSDKWHISNYYATFSCFIALIELERSALWPDLNLSVRWLLSKQQQDGGWGEGQASREETAYGLLMLKGLPVSMQTAETQAAITRAKSWLNLHYYDPDLPLWIGKEFYGAPRAVQAAVIAALS